MRHFVCCKYFRNDAAYRRVKRLTDSMNGDLNRATAVVTMGWSKKKGNLQDMIDHFVPLRLEDIPSYDSTVV